MCAMYLLGGVGRVGAVAFQHLDEFLAEELHSGHWVEYIPADAVCARYISWLLRVFGAAVTVTPREMGAALKTRSEQVFVSHPRAKGPAFYKLHTDPVGAAAAPTSIAAGPPVRVHKSNTASTHQKSLPNLVKALKGELKSSKQTVRNLRRDKSKLAVKCGELKGFGDRAACSEPRDVDEPRAVDGSRAFDGTRARACRGGTATDAGTARARRGGTETDAGTRASGHVQASTRGWFGRRSRGSLITRQVPPASSHRHHDEEKKTTSTNDARFDLREANEATKGPCQVE
jgi:hypothetical protein